MSTRYRNNRRTSTSGPAREPRWMELRYAGECKVCRRTVPAGETAFYDYAARTVTCSAPECCAADGLTREEWRGSPVSGGYVTVTAATRLGAGYKRERTWKERYGRCEDAPCCGCCGPY